MVMLYDLARQIEPFRDVTERFRQLDQYIRPPWEHEIAAVNRQYDLAERALGTIADQSLASHLACGQARDQGLSALKHAAQDLAQPTVAARMSETLSILKPDQSAIDVIPRSAAIEASRFSAINEMQKAAAERDLPWRREAERALTLRSEIESAAHSELPRVAASLQPWLPNVMTDASVVPAALRTLTAEQALIPRVLTDPAPMLASLRDFTYANNVRPDFSAAYGPFVHIHPDPPSWDRWYEPKSYDPGPWPEESPDTYEKNDTGIYVRNKGGRPPGPSILTKGRFIETVRMCARDSGQPPAIDKYVEYMCNVLQIQISESTVRRYCRWWGIRWSSLRSEMADC